MAEAPSLSDDLMFYYIAFLELGTERQYEGGPIPQSKVREWADDAELIGDQRDEFILILMGVDLEYREWAEEKRRKNASTETKPTRGPHRPKHKR